MRLKTITSICTVTLCAVFLTGFGLWTILRTPDELSISERRTLATMPVLTFQDYLDGSFATDFDAFAADQFPLRDRFRTVKAVFSYDILHKGDNNDVYIVDGYASRLDYPLSEDSIAHAAERFAYLYDRYLRDAGSTCYLSVIPDKNVFLAAANGYPAVAYDTLIASLREKTDGYMTYIDIMDTLSIADYYKTDTHWRAEKLMDTANRLADGLGVQLTDAYVEETLDVPFYGVYYGYAALPMEPDTIAYLTNDTLSQCVVTNYETGETGGIYDFAKAAGKDPYEFFLSGPISYLTIENPRADTDRELIVFRDSFASSIVPLLTSAYQKITLLDIRYLASAYLGSMVDFHGQDTLFLYSTSVLNSSETMK
ncbi:MAG: DHHW family protein [Clostridiales bacterium]|nr:DHHW family protein [Clostridiales bacterium]MDD7773871.1 DHHW family protein [Eubacteriales bacterium]